MSEALQIWLFAGTTVWLCALTGLAFYNALMNAQIKTMLILTCKKAAEILHSPTDHLGIDELLEKYTSNHYDLTHEEWGELLKRCEEISEDKSVPKSERMLAYVLFVGELAKHKLMRKHI